MDGFVSHKKKNQGWKLFHSSAAANKKVLMTSWWSFRGHELFIHTHFYNFKCGPLSSKSIILKERVDHAAIMNISRVWFCRTIFDSPEHEFLPVLYAQFMSILTFIAEIVSIIANVPTEHDNCTEESVRCSAIIRCRENASAMCYLLS